MRPRLVINALLVTTTAVILVAVPLAHVLADQAWDRVAGTRLRLAAEIAGLAQATSTVPTVEVARLSKQSLDVLLVSRRSGQLTITAADGHSFWVSGEVVGNLNGAEQAAVMDAVDGRPADSVRSGLPGIGSRLLVAVPVEAATGSPQPSISAVALVGSTDELRDEILGRWLLVLFGCAGILVFAGLMARAANRSVLRPLDDIATVLRALAGGHHHVRAKAAGTQDSQALARDVNFIAEALQASVEQQRSFLSNASHQLRNPLLALRLHIENLEPYVQPDGKSDYLLTLKDTDHLGGVLDELLRVARVAEAELELKSVNVSAIARTSAQFWACAAREERVRLRLRCPETTTALARQGTLEQVLDVLLDNAIKFSSPGDEVTLLVIPSEAYVTLHVRDQGPGMTDKERRRATERFWRGPLTSGSQGAGLGLPIAKMLITSVGGTLDLHDGPEGQGLDVVVRLPTAAAPRPAPSDTKTMPVPWSRRDELGLARQD